jgi:hypothetical protein
MIGNIPYTPRVRKVLVLAAKEAKALNHTYVGTEHILLGLLLEGDGVAARVLKNLDVDTERTRQEILRELDPNYQPTPEDAATPSKPESRTFQQDRIDTSKRYDVYCTERNQQVVVYRNALFKGTKELFSRGEYDSLSEFLRLSRLMDTRFLLRGLPWSNSANTASRQALRWFKAARMRNSVVSRPYGTLGSAGHSSPTMNRRAIVELPAWTRRRRRRDKALPRVGLRRKRPLLHSNHECAGING